MAVKLPRFDMVKQSVIVNFALKTRGDAAWLKYGVILQREI